MAEPKGLTADQAAWLAEAVNARNQAMGLSVDASTASSYRAEEAAYEVSTTANEGVDSCSKARADMEGLD
jgi:hypothetical protein